VRFQSPEEISKAPALVRQLEQLLDRNTESEPAPSAGVLKALNRLQQLQRARERRISGALPCAKDEPALQTQPECLPAGLDQY
jgi:hypothetical protein